MLMPESKLEIYKLMHKEYYLGDLAYDLVKDVYSFKRNEELEDLSQYPGEFYGIFNRKVRELDSDEIREFIVDRIIPYNRMNLDCYLEYYGLDYWDEWELFVAAKGMCFLDCYWIKIKETDSFKNHITFTNSVRDDLLTEEYFVKKKFAKMREQREKRENKNNDR